MNCYFAIYESLFNLYCSSLSVRSVKSAVFNLNEGSLISCCSFGAATNYCESRSTGKNSEPTNFRASRYLAPGSTVAQQGENLSLASALFIRNKRMGKHSGTKGCKQPIFNVKTHKANANTLFIKRHSTEAQ